MKLYWYYVKRLRGKRRAHTISAIRRSDGQLVSAKSDVLDAVRKHYMRIGNEVVGNTGAQSEHSDSRPDESVKGYDADFRARIMAKLQLYRTKSNTVRQSQHCGLDVPMRMEELETAMGQLRQGKAAGIDGIPTQILKYGGEQLNKSILLLFNAIMDTEQWPDIWSQGTILPLYKKGDEPRWATTGP